MLNIITLNFSFIFKLFFFLNVVFLFTSCKEKCYYCQIPQSNPKEEFTACEGDPRYDNIKKGVTYTDINGASFNCVKE